uniref:RRM domain-containing protein n=1 Tax=Mycena chlorophos TaxID=658473 RepID=A0ABQ0LNJ5_MYCCL|nr:predicted protein [Mycena chlorophos]
MSTPIDIQRVVYVGNLPPNVTEAVLQQWFEEQQMVVKKVVISLAVPPIKAPHVVERTGGGQLTGKVEFGGTDAQIKSYVAKALSKSGAPMDNAIPGISGKFSAFRLQITDKWHELAEVGRMIHESGYTGIHPNLGMNIKLPSPQAEAAHAQANALAVRGASGFVALPQVYNADGTRPALLGTVVFHSDEEAFAEPARARARARDSEPADEERNPRMHVVVPVQVVPAVNIWAEQPRLPGTVVYRGNEDMTEKLLNARGSDQGQRKL